MDTPLPPASPTPDREADIAQNKDIAALSYVWILSVVAYVLRRHSPFVKYHARQGMALFVLSIIFWTVPFVGKILELFVLAFGALGFVFAAQGKWVEVPLVGPLSRGDFKGVRSSWKDFVEAAAALSKSLNIPTPTTSAPPPEPVAPKAAAPAPAPAPAAPAPTPTPAPAAPVPEPPAPTPPAAPEPRSSVSVMQGTPPPPVVPEPTPESDSSAAPKPDVPPATV